MDFFRVDSIPYQISYRSRLRDGCAKFIGQGKMADRVGLPHISELFADLEMQYLGPKGARTTIEWRTEYTEGHCSHEIQGWTKIDSSRLSFLDLPGEVRTMIYELALTARGTIERNFDRDFRRDSRLRSGWCGANRLKSLALFAVSQQVHREAEARFYERNVFTTGRPIRFCQYGLDFDALLYVPPDITQKFQRLQYDMRTTCWEADKLALTIERAIATFERMCPNLKHVDLTIACILSYFVDYPLDMENISSSKLAELSLQAVEYLTAPVKRVAIPKWLNVGFSVPGVSGTKIYYLPGARKRRGGDELVHGDNKRPRRSNA
ncbi:hypothetical protein BU16DRAFT_320651 [Lophium mytilinum]|uniref:Uncharacterized protein n=1 Tax=Lophium mytilinum TaxID=390894 RepID=A0A6A6QZG2_9PEZI|nr:hypothetical protein BU16DRAFT_320651 [Lophium mytilinum]